MNNIKLKQYVVDAFTDTVFKGNPAAICVLDHWLPDGVMLNIAKENNLSETAFTIKDGDHYKLRWFTPDGEVDLCGHATLATAYLLLNYYETDQERIVFSTLSGSLTVGRHGEMYEMDFPAYQLEPVPVTPEMEDAIGVLPLEAYMGRDLLCVFKDENVVKNLSPDLDKLKGLDGLLLQATAKAESAEYDCVSRTFAPKMGIPEDPVCGSGHCHIIPYWSKKLAKSNLTAYQASVRGGVLYCSTDGVRIQLAGKAALFSIAEIYVPM